VSIAGIYSPCSFNGFVLVSTLGSSSELRPCFLGGGASLAWWWCKISAAHDADEVSSSSSTDHDGNACNDQGGSGAAVLEPGRSLNGHHNHGAKGVHSTRHNHGICTRRKGHRIGQRDSWAKD